MIRSITALALTLATASQVFTASIHAQETVILLKENTNAKRGQTAFFDGRMDDAYRLLSKGLKAAANDRQTISILNALCAVDNARNNFKAAKENCTEAIQMNTKYWQAYVNRGNSWKKLGNTKMAYADYCSAYQIAPEKVKGSFIDKCK